MRGYTVRKPVGTKDFEFEVYKGLLEEIGVDLSQVPRTQEPGTSKRWLYVWRHKLPAERFMRELSARTRDKSWEVYELELPAEEVGPLAPLDIIAESTDDGTAFRLSPTSQERTMRRFPNARLAGEVFWATETRQKYERDHGPIWHQVALALTGLSDNQLKQMGGYRIVHPSGTTLHVEAAQ